MNAEVAEGALRSAEKSLRVEQVVPNDKANIVSPAEHIPSPLGGSLRSSAFPSKVITDDARHVSPFTMREKIGRLLWAFVQGTFFRFSFPTWYRWRIVMLRAFGARIDWSSRIRRTAKFECPWNVTIGPNCAIGDHVIVYALGPITLGRRVSVSQYTHLCAGSHDFTRRDLPLIRPPIILKDDAWLGADAFVGPGVTMHEGALLGARGSAFTDLAPWTMHGGNPARAIKPRPAMTGTPERPLIDGPPPSPVR